MRIKTSTTKSRRGLREDFDGHSRLRNPSPFSINTAPDPVFDASDKLRATFLQQQALEQATFFEQKRVVGRMDTLNPLFSELYRKIVEIGNFLEVSEQEPLLTKKHTATIARMKETVAKMAITVANELVPLMDDLAVTGRDEDNPIISDQKDKK